MPGCEPRDLMVQLPAHSDANVDEVVPSHVMVPRCSGVCHEGTSQYHRCVPQEGARVYEDFEVQKVEKVDFKLLCTKNPIFSGDFEVFRRQHEVFHHQGGVPQCL